MDSISYYKNKNVGILGLGVSGLEAAKVLIKSHANIFVFDDKKNICLPAHATFCSVWVKILMVVRDVPKFERKTAHCSCQNEQFLFFFRNYVDFFIRLGELNNRPGNFYRF